MEQLWSGSYVIPQLNPTFRRKPGAARQKTPDATRTCYSSALIVCVGAGLSSRVPFRLSPHPAIVKMKVFNIRTRKHYACRR